MVTLERLTILTTLSALLITAGCLPGRDESGSTSPSTDEAEGWDCCDEELDVDTGDGDGDDWDTTTGDGDGDGDPGPVPLACELDCGVDGVCVLAEGVEYCECPETSDWTGYSCDPCQVIDPTSHAIEIAYVEFSGEFRIDGAPPPQLEYDDANIWLENSRTGDRVHVGNTHDLDFSLRVTPGLYELIYEVETPGPVMPHNPRVQLSKLALLDSREADIEIPVTRLSGSLLLNGAPPPATEYDDANLFLRDPNTGSETFIGNTHDGDYQTVVVPGDYELVYRVETPGEITPRNDGASLGPAQVVSGDQSLHIDVPSVPLQGEFLINGAPAPVNEYADANVMLDSRTGGQVWLGNTHDSTYQVNIIPGMYDFVYMHETGPDVPQNQRAAFVRDIDLSQGGSMAIDIPMVQLTGVLTLNGAAPPVSEFDDGLLYLSDDESGDLVLLGNTHDGAYQVNVIPNTYDVHYAQETAGGTVPENKRARLAAGVSVNQGSLDIDIPAVSVSGSLTLDGQQPPTSVYEDGRIYLRNTGTNDALLLGSTHTGSYAAVLVPGDYEIFYAQEAGGEVPSNQNAALGPVAIQGPVVLDLDIPVVDLGGEFLFEGVPTTSSPSDSGQIYLRGPDGDSVLVGDSTAINYMAKLVSGTYGVYYRSTASVTMPENDNGRFACIRVE